MPSRRHEEIRPFSPIFLVPPSKELLQPSTTFSSRDSATAAKFCSSLLPFLGFVINSLHSLCYPLKETGLKEKCKVALERALAGVTTTLRIPIRVSWSHRCTDLEENDGSKKAADPSPLSCSVAGPEVRVPDLLAQRLKLFSRLFSYS